MSLSREDIQEYRRREGGLGGRWVFGLVRRIPRLDEGYKETKYGWSTRTFLSGVDRNRKGLEWVTIKGGCGCVYG